MKDILNIRPETSRWMLSTRVLIWLLFCLFSGAGTSKAQSNIPFAGGPIMQTDTVYLIFWLPTDTSFDSNAADGVGNYETLLQNFFSNVSGTTYYSIAGQYSGTCSSNPCFVQNSPAAVRVGGTFVDTRPYAHADGTAVAGTQTDPLLDADIQHEVQSIMTQNGLSDGIGAEYFVYTANGIQECFGTPASGAECTFFNPADPSGGAFCAYHSIFTDSSGHDAVYGFMSDANGAGGGCNEGITVSPNGQISSDREVALTSHEFFETVSDPLLDAWTAGGTENGDLCNQSLGVVRADGSNVTLNGARFAVQQIWSNFTSSCSLGLPSIQLAITTGADDLRGDSSATASAESPSLGSLQTFTLKTQFQPGWGALTNNQQMFGFNTATAPLMGAVAITLTSHDSLLETPDNWNIQTILGQEFDGAGNLICQFSYSGNPFTRLTGAAGTAVFDAPACAPPPSGEAVSCNVFDDGYTNMAGPSDAVFINGNNQACLPNGTSQGNCRKWFGRCSTNTTHVAVDFNVFDDGYSNLAGTSDAVFIDGSQKSCLPNGTSQGNCRKWFGRGKAKDGRTATCIVFGDGYTNRSLSSDAVFINSSHQACIPSGTSSGTCQKWWGRCQVH